MAGGRGIPGVIRVAVLMGGPSDEREVSLDSGAAVLEALGATGSCEAIGVEIGRDGHWSLPAAAPPVLRAAAQGGGAAPAPGDEPPPVVLIALHGRFGEDGTVQSMLEAAGLPYSGSGIAASALAMDKERSREVVAAAGLRVARGRGVSRSEWNGDRERVLEQLAASPGVPAFVKPASGGSSVGAGPALDRNALEARLAAVFDGHGDRALVEERVVGREFSCAVLGNRGQPLRALPVVEIIPRHGDWFDYTAKYQPGACEEICPADLTAEEAATVVEAAMTAHRVLGCDGMSRSDFILADEVPCYLETNTIPGMTTGSLCPRAAAADGITMPRLMELLVEMALEAAAQREAERGA